MVFYIHEQGQRRVTPLRSILPEPKVQNVQAGAGQTISQDERHQQEPVKQTSTFTEALARQQQRRALSTGYPLKAYQQVVEQPRQSQELWVQDVMLRPAPVLPEQASVERIREAMQANHWFFVVIDEEERPVGLLSNNELGQWMLGHYGQVFETQAPNAGNLCQKRFYSCYPHSLVRDVASLFLQEHLSAMLVLDQQGQLQGLVTLPMLLQALLNLSHNERWA
ncbi:CBS domain-containing protein [Balneatrix alpica]|uniref:CBS domain-containing protein n=1 Tax=Balneatrix alpica TaxID=75684 RepID=UPI002739A9AC|nr:CBS domain-containing protein [Balneatrix alpica]